MKNIQKLGLLAGLFTPALALAEAVSPQIPVGTLSVNRNLLREGTSPALTWEASYPAPVTDIVTVSSQDSITTGEKVKVSVRVVGVSHQSGATELPVKLDVSVNGGGWSNIFAGASSEIGSSAVYTSTVSASTKFDFQVTGATSKSKSNPQSSKTADWNWPSSGVATGTSSTAKAVEIDGATAVHTGAAQAYLKPYLSTDGTAISVGPRAVLYFTELGSDNNMQDVVVLVTFDEVN